MNKRVEYIDAMRGVTMLLVVYSHILFFGYSSSFCNDYSLGGDSFLSFNSLFILFRMPLFFFISGFILYKENVIWDRCTCFTYLKKKAKVQLIPTFFFLWIYTIISSVQFVDGCMNSSKLGYWFTLTLFEFFFVYVLYRFVCFKIGNFKGEDILLLCAAFVLYFAVTPTSLRMLNLYDSPIFKFLGLHLFKYFVFLS